MNTEHDITPIDGGYACTECGGLIPTGSEAIVAMRASIEQIDATGDPQAVTYQYAGVYHPECVRNGNEPTEQPSGTTETTDVRSVLDRLGDGHE